MPDNTLTLIMEQFRVLRSELQQHRTDSKAEAQVVRQELQEHRREVKHDVQASRSELISNIADLRGEIHERIAGIETAAKPIQTSYIMAKGVWWGLGILGIVSAWLGGLFKVFKL